MIVHCLNCDTAFNVENSQIGKNGRFVRCSICGYEWMFRYEDHLLYKPKQEVDTGYYDKQRGEYIDDRDNGNRSDVAVKGKYHNEDDEGNQKLNHQEKSNLLHIKRLDQLQKIRQEQEIKRQRLIFINEQKQQSFAQKSKGDTSYDQKGQGPKYYHKRYSRKKKVGLLFVLFMFCTFLLFLALYIGNSRDYKKSFFSLLQVLNVATNGTNEGNIAEMHKQIQTQDLKNSLSIKELEIVSLKFALSDIHRDCLGKLEGEEDENSEQSEVVGSDAVEIEDLMKKIRILNQQEDFGSSELVETREECKADLVKIILHIKNSSLSEAKMVKEIKVKFFDEKGGIIAESALLSDRLIYPGKVTEFSVLSNFSSLYMMYVQDIRIYVNSLLLIQKSVGEYSDNR